ncbi:hypothetical protein D3C81_2047930 [compost metagenome]
MSIQMLNLLRRNTGLSQRQRHRATRTTAILRACGQVIRIRTGAVANQLRQRLGASGQGVFQ